MNDKKAYLKKLSDRLSQEETEIDKLKAKVHAAKDDIKAELLKEIDELRAKKDVAKGKIKELQDARDDMWDDIKGGAEKSWTELRGAVSKVYAKLT